ncbi:MAG: 3-mercaptopyruvate sulfurtransferase [Herminiimonas sp.]|nr:3-mercaptopyruvate sulfurtransferase [Herminiimonas sp.]
MKTSPLISAEALAALLRDKSSDVLVCDCTFDLGNPDTGAQRYAEGHIPGAVYIHLDRVLGAVKTGTNGRHPLPSRETFAQAMAALGASQDTHIIAYDANGAMYAARLWWMARWAGHDKVSVLDGGLQAWTGAGNPVSTDAPAARPAGDFAVRATLTRTVDYGQVLENTRTAQRVVVDARAADRFRGENETIDPVGGHIPGARNRFFKENLSASGRFKPAGQLRGEFEALLGGRSADRLIHQCGSGVTACHNLLAMEIAGLEGAALYPGSWSEWCAQPDAPVALGA